MIDVKAMREDMVEIVSIGGSANPDVRKLARSLRECLDELEASRKHVAPCRFDVADARAELARIDGVWSTGQINTWDAKKATSSILDRALAAIDAGWPESAPVAITDAVVEEAAILAWCAPWDGQPRTVGEWHDETSDEQRDTYRNEVRAVLEYAASLGGVATFDPAELPAAKREIERLNESNRRLCALPTSAVDPRAERLTRYRCAIISGTIAGRVPHTIDGIEERAHAMLAAEKGPS